MTTFVLVTWAVFWVYWLIAATTAKASTRTRRSRPAAGLIIIVFIALRVLRGKETLMIHSVPVQVVGVVLFVAGLALAVWARIYLGRNWGMPMSERAEPESSPRGRTGSCATRSIPASCWPSSAQRSLRPCSGSPRSCCSAPTSSTARGSRSRR